MTTKTERYQVIVGNIGTVHTGDSLSNAQAIFNDYKELSQREHGRVGNEDVTLIEEWPDGEEVLDEHEGNIEDSSCDQCVASMINGVYCHEFGCPNATMEGR